MSASSEKLYELEKVRNSWLTHSAALVIYPVAAVAGAALPFFVGSSLMLSLSLQAIIEAIFAVSIGFLLRQNGRISFGHAGFFGAAAYIAALLFKNTSLPGEVAILLALAIPTLIAFLLGLLIVRIPGIAHAMITLAVGQAMYEIAYKWRELTNGDDGLSASLPRTLFGLSGSVYQDPQIMFVVCWLVAIAILFGLTLVARSPFGQLSEAIRENAERARFIGYETTLPRALIYAMTGFVAAAAGTLFMLYNGFVSPGILHWSFSGTGLIMAIIGGTKYIWGPALGAVVYFIIKEVAGDATELWPAIVGGILILVTLCIPQGLAAFSVDTIRKLAARALR